MKQIRTAFSACALVRRALALVLALVMCAGWALGEEDPSSLRLREMFSTQKESVTWNAMSDVPTAAEYLLLHADKENYVGEEIPGTVEAREDMVASLRATVEQSAFYALHWTYRSDSTADLYAAVAVDGIVPYQEASTARFRWQWEEAMAPERNAIGDDTRPQQQRTSDTACDYLTNPDGFVQGPLKIYLEAGEHEIRLDFVSQPVEILSFALTAPEHPLSYEETLSTAIDAGMELVQECVTFEAEDHMTAKNSGQIQRAFSDDPLSTPFEMGYKRLNTMGGGNWASGGQMVKWTFSVPEDGLYPISLRAATATDQLPVYRSVRIDGKLPFAEAASCQIPYLEELQLYTLPWLFPLTAGEHTITLTVEIGEFYPVIQALRAINDDMSRLMLDIVMLVGTNPDPNYDYDIEKGIPDILDQLQSMSDAILKQCSALNIVCGGTSLAENSLRQNAELLLVIVRNYQRIQNNITDITSIQTNLSLWEENLCSQPLQIDKFLVGALENEKDTMAASAWQKAEAMLYNFMLSFYKDYDQVGGRASDKDAIVLDVWASMSIEEADVLKTLCDGSFTAQTGVTINLNIMPAGQLNAGAVNALLLAIVSGNAPDIALGVSTGTPVELAIRDAVVDLSKLPGYEELIAEFPQNTLRANTFMGGVYGIPERLGFTVMFYRKDILSALGLPLPETWQEVYEDILPVLYQNSLEMYIPHAYDMFLYQHGGAYYSDDGLTTTLDDPVCYQAFKSMVELYTKYAVPYTTNFYNRFRTGELPIGIGTFGDYMSLTVGAGNLSGKWGIAPVPGVKREDGSISHATSGSVTSSAVMMTACEEQEAGWEFLKWWLSSQTQAAFAQEVETRIGTGSRVATANSVAFQQLSWPAEDLGVILSTRENAIENPGVLGGYYVARHITNAWNAVITDADQAVIRDEFEHAIEMIQIEMDNKQAEYEHLLQ